jgi:hypothetical protein
MVYPLGTTDDNSLHHFSIVIDLHALVLPELDFKLTETTS